MKFIHSTTNSLLVGAPLLILLLHAQSATAVSIPADSVAVSIAASMASSIKNGGGAATTTTTTGAATGATPTASSVATGGAAGTESSGPPAAAGTGSTPSSGTSVVTTVSSYTSTTIPTAGVTTTTSSTGTGAKTGTTTTTTTPGAAGGTTTTTGTGAKTTTTAAAAAAATTGAATPATDPNSPQGYDNTPGTRGLYICPEPNLSNGTRVTTDICFYKPTSLGPPTCNQMPFFSNNAVNGGKPRISVQVGQGNQCLFFYTSDCRKLASAQPMWTYTGVGATVNDVYGTMSLNNDKLIVRSYLCSMKGYAHAETYMGK